MANSSRAINGGAIFSAVSWSKSLLIAVLGSCNILECNSKVFFAQIYFFVIVFVIASTQWGLLTVFAEIDEKWISRQCNSSFPFFYQTKNPGKKQDELVQILEMEEDFKGGKTLLEERMEALGARVVFLPPFHPEFNPIECVYR